MAAFLHAFWNFLVKKNDDKALAIIAICLGHLPFCIIGLLYTGLPPFSSLGFILLSGVFHTGYLIFLMHTYRFGDLSAVYPIARGFSPLLLVILTFFIGQDRLDIAEIIGVLFIGAALMVFGFSQYRLSKHGLQGIVLAAITGVFIASYSFVDGLGTRQSGSAMAFYGSSAIIHSILLTAYFLVWHRPSLKALPTAGMKLFWIGGGASYLAYTVVLWACLFAPIPVVSSLRETSTLIAVFLGVFILKEKMTWGKGIAAISVLIGIALVRIG